jgi:hypothetical protein
MNLHGEWAAKERYTDDDERQIDAAADRLRIEGLRRHSLSQPDAPNLRWRLLIGLTCGHRYWVRWERWRYPAILPHLYCPQCDVLQPVTLASRRKVRRRMWLTTDDLGGRRTSRRSGAGSAGSLGTLGRFTPWSTPPATCAPRVRWSA